MPWSSHARSRARICRRLQPLNEGDAHVRSNAVGCHDRCSCHDHRCRRTGHRCDSLVQSTGAVGRGRPGRDRTYKARADSAARVPDPCRIEQSTTVSRGARRCRAALTGSATVVRPLTCQDLPLVGARLTKQMSAVRNRPHPPAKRLRSNRSKPDRRRTQSATSSVGMRQPKPKLSAGCWSRGRRNWRCTSARTALEARECCGLRAASCGLRAAGCGLRAETRKSSAGKACLRRGHSVSGMDGAPLASVGRIVVGVVGSHPDHLRRRQSRAVAAQGGG